LLPELRRRDADHQFHHRAFCDPPNPGVPWEYLGLWWREGFSRDPPKQEPLPEVVCEPFDDGWPGYEEPSFVM